MGNITLLAIAASFIYLNAMSTSNSAIVKEVVVVLFLVHIDEYLYRTLQILCPKWLDKICNRTWVTTIECKQEAISEDDKALDAKMEELNEVFSYGVSKIEVENEVRQSEL